MKELENMIVHHIIIQHIIIQHIIQRLNILRAWNRINSCFIIAIIIYILYK